MPHYKPTEDELRHDRGDSSEAYEATEIDKAILRADIEQRIRDRLIDRLVHQCPHYHGVRDGVGVCDFFKWTNCLLETKGQCDIFDEIRNEWAKEKGNGR